MKVDKIPIIYSIKRIKKAFTDKESNHQISSRIAKLIADTATGTTSASDVLVRSISLYLRRQKHLYGDEAYDKSLKMITSFLSEMGDLEELMASSLISPNQKLDINDSEVITNIYLDQGIYGLVTLIERSGKCKTRSQKSNKLLEFGKVLKESLGESKIRSQIAELALALDNSESIYRGACWSMLSDDETHRALELFNYIYYYYLDRSELDKTLLVSLQNEMIDRIGNTQLEQYLASHEDVFKQQMQQNTIQQCRRNLTLKNRQSQEALFLTLLNQIGVDEVVEFINSDTRFKNKAKAILALRAAKAAKALTDPLVSNQATEKLADYAFSRDKSEGTLRNVYFSYQRVNAFEKARKLIVLLENIAGDNPTQRQRNLLWSTPEHLATLLDKVPSKRKTPAYSPISGKVCYVIHNSLPYSSGGYATRGHGLLTGLLGEGINIIAISRPGYPHDISDIAIRDIPEQDEVDGAIYKRIYSPSRRDYSNYEYMLNAAQSYKAMFTIERPAIIIAASNHLDGLPAMFAARELGIPFIYEIRGFWEVTRLSKYPEFAQNPMYEVEKKLEALTATHADHIFTLTQGMIDELEDRGVDTTGKITLLPNSCDVTRFNPTSKDITLANKLDIPLSIPVIGYVGTLVSYEGLDDLAIACGRLREAGYVFRLLIVGNENATGTGKGSIVDQITQIASEHDYEDWLIMPGRVPFEEVEQYYSLIDIAPFPRKAWPVCEIVPPMKTLEALSMKKAVLVSSNKALTEMITHDVNGRIFERGNIDDLTEQLKYFFEHPEKWARYGEAGREFVENERTWKRTSEKAARVIDKINTLFFNKA